MTLSNLLLEKNTESNTSAETSVKDFDTLLAELSAPTHNAVRYNEAGQGAYRKSSKESFEQNDEAEGSSFDPFQNTTKEEQSTEMDPEKALREGQRLAKMVDSGLSLGASLIAKSESAAPYKASSGDMADLSEAWGEVAQVSNIKVNPWMKLAFLNGATYLPIYMKAFNDRRFRLMEIEQEAMRKRQDDLEKKLKKMETEKHESKPGNTSGEESSSGGAASD